MTPGHHPMCSMLREDCDCWERALAITAKQRDEARAERDTALESAVENFERSCYAEAERDRYKGALTAVTNLYDAACDDDEDFAAAFGCFQRADAACRAALAVPAPKEADDGQA